MSDCPTTTLDFGFLFLERGGLLLQEDDTGFVLDATRAGVGTGNEFERGVSDCPAPSASFEFNRSAAQ